jgi:hypothetical protein
MEDIFFSVFLKYKSGYEKEKARQVAGLRVI